MGEKKFVFTTSQKFLLMAKSSVNLVEYKIPLDLS
jgi:hypothetical protein